MPYKSTVPVSASLELTGLSEAQEAACYAAMQAFLERNRLAFWSLKVHLSDDGPKTWRLTVTVGAPAEFDFQVRSGRPRSASIKQWIWRRLSICVWRPITTPA
jgi:hypothetical protein